MWLRAIIFGVELVGFLILSIFVLIKFYKDNVSAGYKKSHVIKNLKFDIMYFSINFAIILALFLFTFPSYVFLSYNKLILVSVVELLSIIIIVFVLSKSELMQLICMLSGIALFVAIVILGAYCITVGISEGRYIDNKQILSEQTEKQSITTLTMFGENQIGYTADIEGNIKTYFFYYKDENDVWNYKELDASEVEIERIQDGNSYLEEFVEKTVYCKLEKKASEPDYITTVEDTDYKLYLNLNQKIEIKKSN